MSAAGMAHVADLVKLGVPFGVATMIVEACDGVDPSSVTAEQLDAFAGDLTQLAIEAMKARSA